jgi:hypothetical protein
MDVSTLTAFLAPFLPYVLKTGERFASEAATRFGEEAWVQARRLWDRLRPKVEEEPLARAAVEGVASAPDDERARGFLELQLEQLLAADGELAEEMQRLWRDAEAANVVVASGEGSVAVGRDATGTIVTGDGAVVTGDRAVVSSDDIRPG